MTEHDAGLGQRLGDWFALRFRPLSVRTAEARWSARNREEVGRPCPCGKPWTVLVKVPRGDVVGSVPPVFPRCEEHKDVPLTVPWSGPAPNRMLPEINQTREKCSWRSAPIGGLVDECGCGTHAGESMR